MALPDAELYSDKDHTLVDPIYQYQQPNSEQYGANAHSLNLNDTYALKLPSSFSITFGDGSTKTGADAAALFTEKEPNTYAPFMVGPDPSTRIAYGPAHNAPDEDLTAEQNTGGDTPPAVVADTNGAASVSGSNANEILDSMGTATIATGGGGNDTYTYNTGYGALTVNNYDPANNGKEGTIQFGQGITAAALSFGITGTNASDLQVGVGGASSGSVTVADAYGVDGLNRLKQLAFADGSTLAVAPIQAQLAGTLGGSAAAIGAGTDFFGTNGHALFLRGSNGALAIDEFDSAGTLSRALAPTYQGSPVFLSATTVVAGGGADFFGLGEAAVFLLDGGTLTAWAFDGTGALNAGQTLLQGVAAGTTVVGGGEDFFGIGGHAAFLRGANGALRVDEFQPGGALLGGQALTTNGAPVTIDATTAVIGGGQDFFRNGDRTVFVRDNGALVAWGFDSHGALNAAQTLIPQGLGTASAVVGAGEDYFGIGGRAVFLAGVGGALTVDEFDGSGTLMQSQVLRTHDQAAPITIDTATIIVGGEDFFGNGTRAVFLRGGGGQLNVWGFDAQGTIQSGQLLNFNGSAVVIDSATTIAGGGQDFFGNGERALFLRGGDGALHAWAFDGYGALNAGLDLKSNGAALVVDTATSVIGGGEDFFGNGERALFLRGGNGALHAWAFDGGGTLNAGLDLVGAQGRTITVDTGTKVVGGGENFFGNGDHVAFVRASDGGLGAWDVDAYGTVNLQKAFTLDGATPLKIDTATKVVGDAGDYFQTGGHAIFVQDASGTRHVWEFNGAGVRTGVQ